MFKPDIFRAGCGISVKAEQFRKSFYIFKIMQQKKLLIGVFVFFFVGIININQFFSGKFIFSCTSQKGFQRFLL